MGGAHVYGGGSWKWLAFTCLAVAVGCGWCPRVWLLQLCVIGCPSVWSWQLDVIGTHSLELPVVCGWCPRVWMWQLDVFDAQVC